MRSDPDAVVWRGDLSLPADQQGIKVLGTPLGSPEYVQAMLERLSASHQRLVDRISHITNLQSAWLLLLFCAASRPNYILRVVHPQATRAFAARHDVSMRRCMEILLDVSITNHTWDIGSLPLHMGGLGIRSAVRSRAAAFWSSLGYPELAGQHGRARLVVLASEVGGRWLEECRQLLCLLAKAKVRSEPKIMRSRAKQAWLLRWGSILACSSARAFAMSLLERRGGMMVQHHRQMTWSGRRVFPHLDVRFT